jgi:hypothetical protein
MIYQRPAVQRGRMVNRTAGEPSGQLHERHAASDLDTISIPKRRTNKAPPGSAWCYSLP